jgi:hypothetical protein
MLVIVAVVAQVFPVAAIRRVIVMIAVPVVDGQQVYAGGIELAAALGTDRAVDFERFRPVIAVIVNLAPHPLEDGGGLVGAGEFYGSGASRSACHVLLLTVH